MITTLTPPTDIPEECQKYIFLFHRIKSDHNEDATPDILRAWENEVAEWGKYHSVIVSITDSPPQRQSDQGDTPVAWTPQRFRHIIRLKEEAIKLATKLWADYIWVSYMHFDYNIFYKFQVDLRLKIKSFLKICFTLSHLYSF